MMIDYAPVPETLDGAVSEADVVAEVTIGRSHEESEQSAYDESMTRLLVDAEVTRAYRGAAVGDVLPVVVDFAIGNPQHGTRSPFVHDDSPVATEGTRAVVVLGTEDQATYGLVVPATIVDDTTVVVDDCGPPVGGHRAAAYKDDVERYTPAELADRLNELTG